MHITDCYIVTVHYGFPYRIYYVTRWFTDIIMESSVSDGKFTPNNRPTIIGMWPTAQ